MDILQTVLFLAIAFFSGIIALLVFNELKIILLFITGYFLALVAEIMNVEIYSKILLYFAFVAFSLYVFEYAPRLKFKHTNYEEKISLHYSINSLIASLVAGYIVYLLTGKPFLYIFAFSIAMFVSQLEYVKKKSKISHILQYESNLSILVALVVLFVVFEAYTLFSGQEYFLFAEKFLLSIGLGILTAILLLRFASHRSHHNITSFIIVILAFLCSEVLALPGLTIAVAALLFNTFSTERTRHTFDFFKNINRVTEVFIFVFAGFLFANVFKFSIEFVLLCLTVYALFFFIRFFITSLFAVSLKEKIFLTLNSPKGGIGALLFILLVLTVPRYSDLWAVFFVQIILSELISYMSHYLEDPNTF